MRGCSRLTMEYQEVEGGQRWFMAYQGVSGYVIGITVGFRGLFGGFQGANVRYLGFEEVLESFGRHFRKFQSLKRTPLSRVSPALSWALLISAKEGRRQQDRQIASSSQDDLLNDPTSHIPTTISPPQSGGQAAQPATALASARPSAEID